MNEQYLQDLYGWIKGKDASYESRYNYDTFKQKMQDPEYAKSIHGWITSKDPSFEQRRPLDTFVQQVKIGQTEQPVKAVPSKKKFALESSSENSSLDSQSIVKKKAANDEPASIQNALGLSDDSAIYKAGHWVNALMSKSTSESLKFADNLIVSARKTLQEQGFFDDNIPDTDTPLTDAMKKEVAPKKNKDGSTILTLPNAGKPQMYSDGGPLDPTPLIKGAAKLGLKIINSTLPQAQKNLIVSALNLGSSEIKSQVKSLEKYQEDKLDKSLPTKVLGGIAGMVPDLVVAEAIGSPAAAEGKLTKFATEVSEGARPLIQKYLPKAAKFIEEAVKAPFTKIMAAKGVASGVANAKEGEDIINAGIEGGFEGAKEGVIMHGLGKVAGEVTPKIAKIISKTGLDSKFATAIANPLSNAGVFTTAKAIRTPIEEGRLATGEELALEAGTGIGFSLLHAGSLYKNHNEANHYYDNVLKTDPLESFKRVINETKDNLDLVYNPDLTEAQVKDLESARDEMKVAIIKEPDLNNKKLLGDEAVKIQNQLDAHSAIKKIVENRKNLIDEINNNEDISDESKAFYTKKVEAMADHFDDSELGLKKKELNIKIKEAQKLYEKAGLEFSDRTEASDEIKLKENLNKTRTELEGLNNELNNLKSTQDAIQEQTTDEGLLRSQQSELELQGLGEGNAKPEVSTKETIITAKPEEEITPTEAKPEKEQWEIDYERVKGKLDEFNSENRPLDLDEVSLSERENSKQRRDLDDKVFEAQQKISRADDADAAIEEYNKKKQELQDFDDKTKSLENYKKVNDLIYSEIEYQDQEKDTYEYPEDFNKDPRQAALIRAKEMVEFLKEKGEPEEKILIRENDINILEKDIKDNPLKENTVLRENPTETTPTEVKVETNPELVKTVEELLTPKVEQLTQIQENGQTTTNEVQPERTGNGGTTRTAISKTTPLEGAPKTNGATGPDEQLVSVAEKYANENGVDLKRQGEYVEVDEERAKRIADAYEEMENNPQDSRVKKAYAEMIKQTKAQYQALVDAGYKFWFIDVTKPDNIDYISSPFNAMRDLRQNKQMGVFPTEAGFGSNEEVDVSKNPLLEDTGIMWASGGLDGEMMPVTANDLFRAVHDAFGHGLEGSGFRARGEENAWQAHSRLYTGDAIGAMTSETRGQNSWVNFGPFGEQNRTASAEDTVFADQKVGLMPEWTWTEGRASDMAAEGEVAENLAEENAPEELGTQGLSEAELKGYDRMIGIVDGITKKVLKERGGTKERAFQAALDYLQQDSKVYENATDVQREALVRKLRKQFDIKEKSAPSVGRLFGTIKDIAKITMTEKVALVKQIRDLARGGKDAQIAIKKAIQSLINEIGELRQGGKINKVQEQSVLNRLKNTNVLSEISTRRFIDYVSKIYADAEYSDQLSSSKKIKSEISKLSKDKKKDVNLTDLATKFTKIDPSMVDDIYEYNDMASKIKEAIKGSTIRGQKINWADTVNIQEAIDFTQKTIEIQDAKLRDERIAELESLMGVDASDFTDAEIKTLLEKNKNFTGDDDKIVRAMAKKAFDIYSSVIKEVIRTGEDAFTGEKVDYDKTQKGLIQKFMNMDLEMLSTKATVEARDALLNFLVNKSTARMGLVIEEYEGVKGTKELVDSKIKSRPLSKYGFKLLGRVLGDEVTSLPILFEKMFPGFTRSSNVMNKIGLSNVIQKNDQAVSEANKVVDNYIEKFFNKKANEEDFNTTYNNVERDLAAYMIRSIAGTEEQIQKEFDDRHKVIEGSIEELKNGNEEEKKEAELYQKAYDKILKDSKNAQDVLNKTDKTNVEAINFYIKEFGDRYQQIADVSENVYNTKLEKDINYTPDRLYKLNKNVGEVDLSDDDSAFHNNNGSIILKKAGSLQEIKRLDKIPKGKYVKLSFDKNMANAMYDLLIDVNTAGPIKRLNAAINSPYFEDLMSNTEDLRILKGDKRDRTIGRVELYIKNMRNKNPYSNDELSKAMKNINKVATVGVGQALAGVSQPFKQIIPVALNTFINADGKLNLGAAFNTDKIAFINNSGYGIANRGRQSQAEIESVNKLIEKASLSKGQKLIKAIEDINELQLRYLLEKPDVFIAKISWLTYYEQSLKKQGIDTKTLNYKENELNTHKLNKEAADYAEKQVTRQQNLNNHDLAGRLYTNKTTYAQIFTKMLMSFSSFRMNSSSRFGADMITLQDKTSSKEDRSIAIKSIKGYAAEQAVFRVISIGASLLIGTLAMKFLGKDESDEDYKKRKDNTIKGAKTGAVVDLFSPVPILDPFVQQGGAKLTEGIDELMGTDIAIYDVPKQNFLKEYGTFGITADRLIKLWELGNLAATGKYKDEYGKEKTISDDEMKSLRPLVPLFVATSVGILPNEINSGINNAVKFSKKGEGKINKTELKKTNPDEYEKIYGKNSSEDRIKEREKIIKEREKRQIRIR